MTDEDRKKLRDEELFRSEIRKELDRQHTPKTKSQKLMEFLNSPFGLFVMSSLVLGFITFLYEWNSDRLENNSKAEGISSKIKIELTQRFENLLLISDSVRIISRGRYYNNDDGIGPSLLNSAAAYEEFDKRSIHSLFFELFQITKNPLEKRHTKEMMMISKKIPFVLSKLHAIDSDTNSDLRLKDYERTVLRDTILLNFKKWKEIAAPE